MVGFEPTVYRFLQLQCLIIHAACVIKLILFDHWSLSPCLSREWQQTCLPSWATPPLQVQGLRILAIGFPATRGCQRLQGFPPWTTASGSFELHFSRKLRSSLRLLRLSGSITGISSIMG